jgi:hypothetical protein
MSAPTKEFDKMKTYTLTFNLFGERQLRQENHMTEESAGARVRGLANCEFFSIVGPTHVVTSLRPLVRSVRI